MPADAREATNLELWGLYNVQRTSYLNLLYYGARAAFWAKWSVWLQGVAAVGSLGAVTGFLTVGGNGWGKWLSALIGAISAVCAALPAIIGHAEKINKFEKLHFVYSELFELTTRTVMDIRRSGLLTQQQAGAALLLNDLLSRLGQMDDTDLKEPLRRKYESMVRERFPKDHLWYAEDHERATQTEAAISS
jgi:hypothetical protein